MSPLMRNVMGVLLVLAWLAGLLAYRAWGIEPREWGALCASGAPPLACLPRGALLWLQHFYLWGALALVAGLLAFAGLGRAWLPALAVALGAAAVINYNATWGMVGVALGGWAWLIPPRRRPATR
jgi:hypothetical protein